MVKSKCIRYAYKRNCDGKYLHLKYKRGGVPGNRQTATWFEILPNATLFKGDDISSVHIPPNYCYAFNNLKAPGKFVEVLVTETVELNT